MKTIEIIRFTGEMETITETIDGKKVEREQQVFETVKEYDCEEGEENSLLSRARLTAELYNRDREGDFQARIKV